MKNFLQFIFLAGFVFSSSALWSQEYDDLYFSKKDREKKDANEAATTVEESEVSVAGNEETDQRSFLSRQMDSYPMPDESYDLPEEGENGGVSEESINHYKRATIDDYVGEDEYLVDETEVNPAYSNPEEAYQAVQQPVVVNNYYGGSPVNTWGGAGWGWGVGSRWGWRSGWGFSVGFGNGWYDPWGPWGWYDPWFGWGVNSWGWNAWYGPYWGWGNPYRGFYGRPYAGRFYGNRVIASEGRRSRTVTRGSRSSRGGTVSSATRSRSTTSNPSSVSSRSRSSSDHQSTYLDRSRRSNSSGSNSRSSSSVNNRSSSSSSGNSSRSYNNRSSRSRSSSSGSYNHSGSSSRSSRSVSPSRSGSRSSGSVRSSSGRSSGRSAGRSSSGRSGSRSSRGRN